MGKTGTRIPPEVMGCLQHYQWPGNVRELKNVIERMLIMAPERELLAANLPVEIRKESQSQPLSSKVSELPPLWKVEEDHIRQVLEVTGHNHSRAAAMLGISRSTLLAKLKKSKDSVSKSDMS
jgi:DNA-binding NtrC family response regulator